MFKKALVTLGLALAIATPAAAADLGARVVKPTPVLIPPAFTWTGPYVGAYVGGPFGDASLNGPNANQRVGISPDGVTVGGLAGYNYQIDRFVLGVEGEFGYTSLSGNSNYVNGLLQPRNAAIDSSYIGRIRGRLGYALGPVLIFAASGVSFIDIRIAQRNVALGLTDSLTKTQVGWNAGIGGEYPFSPNWIGRVEYIFDRFETGNYNFFALPLGLTDRKVGLDVHTVRIALEYKF